MKGDKGIRTSFSTCTLFYTQVSLVHTADTGLSIEFSGTLMGFDDYVSKFPLLLLGFLFAKSLSIRLWVNADEIDQSRHGP